MTKRSGRYLFFKLLRWGSSGLVITVLISLAYVYIPVLISPADNYLARKGNVKSASITRQWQERDSDFYELDLESDSGLIVQAQIRIPMQRKKPLPVALLLGGVGTGRDACRIIPEIKYAVCVSISYPYHGTKNIERLGFLKNLRELQQVVKDTPPALMLALDYVLSQPYSDSEQVEVLGVSFGAYFICIPAVIDQRVTRVWVAHGGAEPIKVMMHNYFKQSGRTWVDELMTHMVGYAIGSQHVDPEKWVGKISPRPVVLINAENDKTFPASSVAALHNAAKQPKQIIWTKGMHVTPGRKEVVEQISDIILIRIEGDYLKRQ